MVLPVTMIQHLRVVPPHMRETLLFGMKVSAQSFAFPPIISCLPIKPAGKFATSIELKMPRNKAN